MVEIRTPRLRLRRASLDDVQDLHAVLSDPVAMRYWSTPPHDSIEQTRDWVADMIGAPAATADDFVVDFQGTVIGKAGCWRFPEIGFIFHPDYWGRGFAHEALMAVIERMFALHAIDVLEADVDPRNAASLRLLHRLGFRETRRAERTWMVGGQWCDSVYLALMRRHHMARRAWETRS